MLYIFPDPTTTLRPCRGDVNHHMDEWWGLYLVVTFAIGTVDICVCLIQENALAVETDLP